MQRELTAERARELLDYDCETGEFTWRVRKARWIKPGDAAGSRRPDGYIVIGIDGRRFHAHRIAVLWTTGKWPEGDVDHIDGDTSNNRWKNLRDVPTAYNIQNQRAANVDSLTGILGVCFDKARRKFKASIGKDGRTYNLGRFDTAEEAHAAYVNAKREMHGGGLL